MGIPVTGQVGPSSLGDGATSQPFRQGRQGDVVVSELHGRFYEQTYRGNVYGAGVAALVPLSATTITLTATTTPILGVWNPANSTVNLVLLQATLTSGINAAASTGPGAFVWAMSSGNGVNPVGHAPTNHKFLSQQGSQARAYPNSASLVALTGLTNNLIVQEAADFPSPTIITTAAVPTSVQTPTVTYTQNFDGQWIIPPGSVFALLNTVSTTTVSVYGRILWEEVPI